MGIGIPYLLMNLFSFHGFQKNMESIVVLKCPKRMLEYYFSKGFGILECNSNHVTIISNLVKYRIQAEETHNIDYFMTCINTISSVSNTLKKLLFNKILYSSYIQTEFNDKKTIINNTFITYV